MILLIHKIAVVNELTPLSRKNINRHRNDREIVQKTVLQIIKDFDRFGIEIKFPGDLKMAYDDLLGQILPIIQNLLVDNTTVLYSLLYAIDLSERTISKGVADMKNLELHEVISHLLLDRELHKVLTRDFFSRST